MKMKNPVHPGEILKEDVIEALGITITDAAEMLGVTRPSLSKVLNCHAAISPTMAVRLEIAGIGTARAWSTMQARYDLAQAEQKIKVLRGEVKRFPVANQKGQLLAHA